MRQTIWQRVSERNVMIEPYAHAQGRAWKFKEDTQNFNIHMGTPSSESGYLGPRRRYVVAHFKDTAGQLAGRQAARLATHVPLGRPPGRPAGRPALQYGSYNLMDPVNQASMVRCIE